MGQSNALRPSQGSAVLVKQVLLEPSSPAQEALQHQGLPRRYRPRTPRKAAAIQVRHSNIIGPGRRRRRWQATFLLAPPCLGHRKEYQQSIPIISLRGSSVSSRRSKCPSYRQKDGRRLRLLEGAGQMLAVDLCEGGMISDNSLANGGG